MCCNISIKRGDNLKMAKATIQNKKRMMGILGFFAVFILYLVCHMFYWQLGWGYHQCSLCRLWLMPLQ